MKRLWGCDEYDWCESLASETHSGGIFVVWDPSKFNVSQKHIRDRWTMLEGCINSVSFMCSVGVIYSPSDILGRSLMYEFLKSLIQSINKSLLLLSDFSEILHPSERIGQFRYDLGVKEFLEWIHDLYLIDIPLHGIKFNREK